jgi:hypothetical protein
MFSLLPGAGEMYMGFMKMGVSLMSMFFAIIAVAAFLDLGPLIFVAVVVWFYGFFHVHNLAGMPDEEFYAVEDDYLFKFIAVEKPGKELIHTYRNVIAAVLIILGVMMTWNGFFSMLGRYIPEGLFWMIQDCVERLPQLVVGIAIIVLGIYMIRGKKQQLDDAERKEQ